MSGHTTKLAPRPTSRSPIIVGLGFLALGVPMALFGLYFLVLGDASRNWPTVTGVVESSAVRVDPDISRSSQPRGTRARTKRRHIVKIVYRYEVNNQVYRSSRYSFGSGNTAARAGNRVKALAIARESFPVGSAVQVSYDPEHPRESVLAAGLNWGTFVPLVLGLVFGIAGFGIVALGIRQRSQVDVSAVNEA